MSKNVVIGALLILALLGVLVVARASADGGTPPDISVFALSDGHTCVVWPDGSGDCYCACEECYATQSVVESPVVTPTDKPDKPKPKPTIAPTEQPTDEPTAVPTDKPKCNKGGGNGGEGCDPGNNPDKGHDDE